MIINSDNIIKDVEENVDVCVVGSGPAGSVMAMEMAGAGFEVIVLEEGDHFSRSDLNMREADMLPALYQQRFTKDLSISLSQGKCLGGGSLINMADSVRTPDAVFRRWEREFGVTDISPGIMKGYFERVETILKTKKIEEVELNSNNLILRDAADKSGYSGDTFYHNREGCLECGHCLLGCPFGKKQATTLNYIPMAEKSGVKFYVNVRAEKVVVEGGRVKKMIGTILDRETGDHKATINVSAKVIVLAAGTINTPQILLGSEVSTESGLVGKNLLLQPNTMIVGLFPEELKSYKGIPQAYYADQFEVIDEERGLSGFRLEGGFTLPGQVSTIVPGFGHSFKELMTRYSHMANMMVLVYDEPNGSVALNRQGRPVIKYEMGEETKALMIKGMKEAANLMFIAGAERVMFTYEAPTLISDPSEINIVDERGIEPCSLTLMSFHMQGTCRMGPDPRSSIVDSYLECHGTKNLFIVDGSVAPSTASSHNMLPTMALSHRTADYIITNRSRYFG